jgi:hypothetical protein
LDVQSASHKLTATGEVELTVKPAPDTPLERRVELLEQSLGLIRERLRGFQQETRGTIRELASSIALEEQQRHDSDDQIRRTLVHTATGGIDISVGGALLLLIGVTLSSASLELARWAAR